jgi:hypothetical protein
MAPKKQKLIRVTRTSLNLVKKFDQACQTHALQEECGSVERSIQAAKADYNGTRIALLKRIRSLEKRLGLAIDQLFPEHLRKHPKERK